MKKTRILNILFRTSGGSAPKKELGMGHIFRTINLAKNLIPHNIHFLIEDHGGVYKNLRKKGFENIHKIKKNPNLLSDIKKTKNLVRGKKIDLLIIDTFNIKKKFVQELRKITRVVVISDLRDIDFPANLVVNGYIGFRNKIITNRFKTKCLLGPKYQILDESCKKIKSKKKKFFLLATFGGYDEHNISEIFCQSIEQYLKKIKVRIILGPATFKTKKIRKFEKIYSKTVSIIKETRDMCDEISQSHYGICSGGITSYEFASKKVPFAIICQHRHQLKTATEWEKKGIALNFGLPNGNTTKKIQSYIERIIQNTLHSRSIKKSLVDGYGSKRAADEILKICSN
jgi:spore coat polysaccharide biosynthesis predicted glycosyltransferase SpsG